MGRPADDRVQRLLMFLAPQVLAAEVLDLLIGGPKSVFKAYRDVKFGKSVELPLWWVRATVRDARDAGKSSCCGSSR